MIVVGYGLFEARGIVFGPRIQVDETPLEVFEQFVRIQGSAARIAALTMNGAAISVTEEGFFDEPLLLHRGENRIVLRATDKYGNATTRTVTLVYIPPSTTNIAAPGHATDTAAAAQPIAPAE